MTMFSYEIKVRENLQKSDNFLPEWCVSEPIYLAFCYIKFKSRSPRDMKTKGNQQINKQKREKLNSALHHQI